MNKYQDDIGIYPIDIRMRLMYYLFIHSNIAFIVRHFRSGLLK
jgi:hypothetical protein